jgi:hypothetical protein
MFRRVRLVTPIPSDASGRSHAWCAFYFVEVSSADGEVARPVRGNPPYLHTGGAEGERAERPIRHNSPCSVFRERGNALCIQGFSENPVAHVQKPSDVWVRCMRSRVFGQVVTVSPCGRGPCSREAFACGLSWIAGLPRFGSEFAFAVPTRAATKRGRAPSRVRTIADGSL